MRKRDEVRKRVCDILPGGHRIVCVLSSFLRNSPEKRR